MKAEVIITNHIEDEFIEITNNLGMSWRYNYVNKLDVSLQALAANIVAAQLTATITDQLHHIDARKFKYKLEVLTDADAR